ncbi:FAD-dependent oxidoreductase [Micromonospora cathayae]|uniref:FAD-binding protein n=1 Tax=Micromonospora cathayae TaxID=3028804 RepID=A0ABY7ZMJ6_9ACTN|nr:FAD-binding protein [Micromonospora sp. HUAS 3]WDZ83487.1 FAD-binding protein [Micromonospora sp. HUAS 3]
MTDTVQRTVAPGLSTPPAVTPDDPRYESLLRGTNHRFVPRPDEVRVATTTEQVVAVVADAVATGRRIAVRSGGHGFEDFTASADVRVLLDLSEMTEVRFDAERRAFSVQPGATLGHVYRVLFKGWGVTLPGGECAEVGVGGHFAGGGYGPLSRRDGSIVDYLHAVEVVVVDADGGVRVVVATDDPADPHHDLWWAHTGGGGGNFGIVTRYWLRAPGESSADPADLLPKAPARWRTAMLLWSWEGLSEADFTAIMRNVGTWFERNSAPDSPARNLTGFFVSSHRSGWGVSVGASIDADVPDAEEQVERYLAAMTAGVAAEPVHREQKVRPWLYGASYPGWGDPGTIDSRRIKIKAAYLRRGYRDGQLATIYRHLSGGDAFPIEFILIGYGGRVNAIDPAATATAQRDSILKAAFLSVWPDQAQDDTVIARLREMYRDVYAETGGVPVPDEVSDGSYINYPDADLADPAWNTSGVPWHDLYYRGNYPRLQQVKRRYDPNEVFRHALSVRPAADPSGN